MAHFAKIENGIVREVVVISNEALLDEDGIDRESIGVALCKSLFGDQTNWIQTSYNSSFRGKFAGLNDIWNGNEFVVTQ